MKSRCRYASLEDRLLANSVLAPDGDCWWWTGKRHRNDYPRINIRINGRVMTCLVHRVAYEEWKGPIPEGMTIDHMCEVTWCINPAHLQPLPNEANCKLKNRHKR